LTVSDETSVAKVLCDKLGVQHVVSILRGNLADIEVEKNERLSYEAFQHGWVWKLAQDMRSGHAVSYDGIAGDVLSAGHFHDDENSRLYREQKFDALAERLAPRRGMLRPPHAPDDSQDTAHHRIVTELLRYRNAHNPMMFFYLYNRSRRAVSPTISYLYGSTLSKVFAPFLDRGVFDFLAGLPEDMFADKSFHTEAIAKRFPAFSSVRYSRKSPPSQAVGGKYAWDGLKFAMSAPRTRFVSRRNEIARFLRAAVASKYRRGAPGLFSRMVLLAQVGHFSR
jgi:hypothetical protein